MGIQTMNSHVNGSGQQSHVQHPVTGKNLSFSLTLDQVQKQLNYLGKPLGSMNLDELVMNVITAEARNSSTSNNSPAATLQRQASLSLVKAFRGRTVDEVWKDIERGDKMRNEKERQPTLGETTLEDFLVKAGMYVTEASIGRAMSLDSAFNSENFAPKIELSRAASVDSLSDTSMSWGKRNSGDVAKTVERRLKRKIKNRESAARSRARKQAYHNELVTKVSHLEEENVKLRKEKEFEQMLCSDPSEPRYQLRRTSSF